MPRIKYLSYGIASRVGDNVYLHKNLVNYPELHNAILKHEFSHTSGFSWKDVQIDIRNSHLKGLRQDYYAFLIQNPTALLQLSPILRYEGQLTFDLTLIMFYGVAFIILGLLGWLL
jgi:hypothetical protein